jgi:hypothetical protein
MSNGKGAAITPSTDTLEIIAEVYTSPRNDVAQSSDRYFRGPHDAIEIESNDDPPTIRNQNGRWRDTKPDFDGLLGLYEFKKKRITIFKKGILWVANENEWEPGRLEKLVRLHEWAHAVHHLGSFDKSGSINTRALNESFHKASDDLKEQIAQLATLVSLKASAEKARYDKSKEYHQRLQDMFFSLMSQQSDKYHLPGAAKCMSKDHLLRKLRLMFRISDAKSQLIRSDVWDILAIS